MMKVAQSAPGPEVVAKTIWKAANSNHYTLRYAVGSGAPFLLFLRRIILNSWFMGMVKSITER
jgi:hypothetical protein